MVEEELDGIDRDGIGNVNDSLMVVSLLEILTNKKPDVLQACRCPLCGKRYRREYFFI